MDLNVALAVLPFLTGENGSPISVEKFHSNKTPKSAKQYNCKWENDPILKTWIARHPRDSGKVICRYCHSVIRAHKNDLLEHTRTLKHQRNFQQNTDPEVFNLFVMELNGMRKDNTQVPKKRNSLTSSSNINLKCDLLGSPTTNHNSTNNNNATLSLSPVSSSGCIQTTTNNVTNRSFNSSTSVSVSAAYVGNSNGYSTIDPAHLDGDDLWHADIMSTHTPRDYLKVILEEPPLSVPPSDWTPTSLAKCSSLVNDLQQESQKNNDNDNEDEDSIDDEEESDLKPNPVNDHTFSNSLDDQINLNNNSLPTQINNNNPSSTSVQNQPMFTALDVIAGIQNGRFHINEVCSIMKSSISLMEGIFLSVQNSNFSNDSPVSQNYFGLPMINNPPVISIDLEKLGKKNLSQSKKRGSSVLNEDESFLES